MAGMQDGQSLGARVRQRRTEKNISAAELARRANISKAYLSEIEHDDDDGTAAKPSAEVLYRIATALGTTVADLLGRQEHVPAPRGLSDTLRKFAEDASLPRADVEMLARIRFRGNQPTSVEDWRFLYEAIRRSVRPGD